MSLSPSDNYSGASYLGNIKENWLFQLYNQDSYLRFDGTDDFIDCGTTSSAITGITSNITIAFWIRFPASVIGESINDYIFMSNSIADYFTGFQIYKDSADKISILVSDGGNDNDYKRIRGDVVSADTWYFVAIISDMDDSFDTLATTTILYNNSGTTESAADSSWNNTKAVGYSGSGKTLFGKFLKPDPDGYAEFDIKNFAIWDVQLDSDNLTAIYNSGNFLNLEQDSGNYDQSSNLKAYWEFNNGENFTQDLTNNISTGTITGAKYKGFLPLALRDTTVDDVFYHGVINSSPSIRNSINLIKSKSKTGNISVNLINAKYQGDDLSAELFLGTNNYYNRTVKVYSQLNELNTLADCLQLYHGRLTNISHNDSSIKLSIIEKSPWDNKSLPVDKSNRGTFHPIVYGAFTTNNSPYSAPQYLENSTYFNHHVFPVKVDYVNYNFHCVGHKAVTSTDATLHFYESAVDEFIPLHNVNNSASTSYISSSGQDFTTKYDLQRSFQFKPKTSIGSHDWTNVSNMVEPTTSDDDTLSFATTSLQTASTSAVSVTHDEDTTFTLPNFSDFAATTGDTHGFTVGIRSDAIAFYSSTNQTSGLNQHYYALYDYSTGSASQIGTNRTAATTAVSTGTSVTVSLNTQTKDLKTSYNEDGFKDGFVLRWRRFVQTNADGNGGGSPEVRGFGTLRIYDVRFKVTLALAIADNTEWKSKIGNIKELYSGADGFTASWDDGAITLGHDAHRDMLIRYAGMSTIEPENWTTLEADRSAWTIRYWINEEISLLKALEKLQYEFGFIHKIDPSGKSKYVWIHGTDSDNVFQASDVDVTLTKADISSLEISTSSVEQIMTKAIINTEKHPAKNDYITTTTATNATPRTKYNIKSKENTATINLDALTLAPATSPVDDKQADFYSYYSQANGDVKKIVSCEIINTQKGYLLETGDIVKFEDMPVDPFADNWADYYMVTDLTRSPGKIKIKVREVG